MEFHRDQVQKPSRQKSVCAFLEAQTGRSFEIRCEHREPEPKQESEGDKALKTVLNMFPGSEVLKTERKGDAGATEGRH